MLNNLLLVFHCFTFTHVVTVLDMILKICNFKKGNRDQRLCKQVRYQIVWKQVEDTAQGLPKNENKF